MKLGFDKKKSSLPTLNFAQIFEYLKYRKFKKSVLVYIASQLSDSEIGELKNQFFEIDKDEDGMISFEDFSSYIKASNEKISENDQKIMFEAMDMSKNGFINYNGKTKFFFSFLYYIYLKVLII